MKYIILIVSFLLEGMLSIFFYNTLFVPVFTIVSIVIIYKYFKNDIMFLITCLLSGLLYDIIYTDSIFINMFAFLLMAGFIIYINKYIKGNFIGAMFLNVIVIVLYRIITYFLLCMFEYITFNENVLIKGICNSMLINIIYEIIIYYICNMFNKEKIKRS